MMAGPKCKKTCPVIKFVRIPRFFDYLYCEICLVPYGNNGEFTKCPCCGGELELVLSMGDREVKQ